MYGDICAKFQQKVITHHADKSNKKRFNYQNDFQLYYFRFM